MKFYIVATPIGNLSDMTFRAILILKLVDIIYCEDTRVTKKLLDNYNIKTPINSYHKHSGDFKVNKIIELLKQDKNIAYVSDAGTPGISDPVSMLVEEIVNNFSDNIIESIPGASSLITALSLSGFNCDNFVFFGFIPHKKGKETMLKEIIDNKRTSVFFESTHRIIKTLERLKLLGIEMNRKIVLARELTKKFETVYRGNIEKILNDLKSGVSKGEFVVIIDKK
ncbi:MAG: 16S rRNA (cytidine(1402)-2'-O)-methyltransferase [Patescibacteria group bacterium]|nr:16S rRNA (cytidine(1402)-2'-O)-methyltransferase [Patescibacteria group bacterium]MDD4304088.1 16S rRNA (cytidine(1402)-2'-O)-methyltransferase [Patescibacteria group bacterium]MDD4694965.1 16S rRNA (cytidine(1402)-2'-O)-methyltransferase [Patescibacteria group bacterium]